MDITVKRLSGHKWSLKDLLGRAMGRIVEDPPKQFTVRFDVPKLETLFRSKGRYATLNEARANIETQTRGVCRMDVSRFEKLTSTIWRFSSFTPSRLYCPGS